jgi:hypothetical protein
MLGLRLSSNNTKVCLVVELTGSAFPKYESGPTLINLLWIHADIAISSVIHFVSPSRFLAHNGLPNDQNRRPQDGER